MSVALDSDDLAVTIDEADLTATTTWRSLSYEFRGVSSRATVTIDIDNSSDNTHVRTRSAQHLLRQLRPHLTSPMSIHWIELCTSEIMRTTFLRAPLNEVVLHSRWHQSMSLTSMRRAAVVPTVSSRAIRTIITSITSDLPKSLSMLGFRRPDNVMRLSDMSDSRTYSLSTIHQSHIDIMPTPILFAVLPIENYTVAELDFLFKPDVLHGLPAHARPSVSHPRHHIPRLSKPMRYTIMDTLYARSDGPAGSPRTRSGKLTCGGHRYIFALYAATMSGYAGHPVAAGDEMLGMAQLWMGSVGNPERTNRIERGHWVLEDGESQIMFSPMSMSTLDLDQ
ncbi:uncharacterized protein STEHIDRAFT_116255 [Stereum hirsutum FP-91666 SS1]|uniref:Uncharacterized protein n=1 Tax=Stereum hirsutum (strain FP-91666) TaxID=721885 RepID=R7RZN0_STEHR|nr:uncharacterized protein STEHIDRAFT_116255 [Stereum hirsutum FP-91666 SS1]EIM79772.1 hypothetical protein STEHIDRAFT_116255 [Stereum hirsutum FP-91666 SS1]